MKKFIEYEPLLGLGRTDGEGKVGFLEYIVKQTLEKGFENALTAAVL